LLGTLGNLDLENGCVDMWVHLARTIVAGVTDATRI
jgi:hypothetical protein